MFCYAVCVLNLFRLILLQVSGSYDIAEIRVDGDELDFRWLVSAAKNVSTLSSTK